jgi:hypothetical protein
MMLFLDKELRKLKLHYVLDNVGNILVTKDKSSSETKYYPCVVSHMDTVHDFVDNFTLYIDANDKDVLFAKSGKKQKQQAGIGGDDKCGVFACLYFLKVIPKLKVVFFTKEETLCKGSRTINKNFFSDCSYIIQLDRRGKSDFIATYVGDKTVSQHFSSEIGKIKKEYGFKNATGTITDVMTLWKNSVGISCVNISSGYHQPHTDLEYVSMSELWNSIKFVEKMILTLKDKRYLCSPPKKTYNNNNNWGYNSSSTYEQCDKCKAWKSKNIMFEKQGKFICMSCNKALKQREKQTEKEFVAENNNDTANPFIYLQSFYRNLTDEPCSKCRRKDAHNLYFLSANSKKSYCYRCALEEKAEQLKAQEKTTAIIKIPAKCECCGRLVDTKIADIIISNSGAKYCKACWQDIQGYCDQNPVNIKVP